MEMLGLFSPVSTREKCKFWEIKKLLYWNNWKQKRESESGKEVYSFPPLHIHFASLINI